MSSTDQPIEDAHTAILHLAIFYLALSAGSTQARQYPLSYIPSGHYSWSSGVLDQQGRVGRWWTTTPTGSTTAYALGMDIARDILIPQDNNGKIGGDSLRFIMI